MKSTALDPLLSPHLPLRSARGEVCDEQELIDHISEPFTLQCALGEFTEQEITFLKQNGKWLEVLTEEIVKPSTDAQRHFVEVCRGHEPPATEHENLWHRYRFSVLVKDVEDRLSDGRLSYASARTLMARLVQRGSEGARRWLETEGHWKSLPSIGRSQSTSWENGRLYGITHLYNDGIQNSYIPNMVARSRGGGGKTEK